jgi:hypothetical protein
MNLTTAQVCSALGVTYLQLLSLMRNAAFPAPLTNDGQGNLTFDSGAISTFGSLLSASLSNWPALGPDSYASANFAALATSAPGPFANSPGGIFGGQSTGGVYGTGSRSGGLFD